MNSRSLCTRDAPALVKFPVPLVAILTESPGLAGLSLPVYDTSRIESHAPLSIECVPDLQGFGELQTDVTNLKEDVEEMKKSNKISTQESRIEKAIFDQWEQDEVCFISTKVCNEVKKIIKSRNMVVVAGHSGSGKSAIIQHIALKYREQGWTVLTFQQEDLLAFTCNQRKMFITNRESPCNYPDTQDQRTGGRKMEFTLISATLVYDSFNCRMRALKMGKLDDFMAALPLTHTPRLGESVELNCIPPPSYPPAELQWVLVTPEGHVEPVNYDNRILDGRLYITNVQEQDRQEDKAYVCLATNYFMRRNTYDKANFIIPSGSE
uniref:Uncharacterized protein n=1 Tax=Magallana gigas TaxID=29159 RepID=K1PUI2_MAGGI